MMMMMTMMMMTIISSSISSILGVSAFKFYSSSKEGVVAPSLANLNLRLRSAECAACHRVVSQLHARLLPKIKSQMKLERERLLSDFATKASTYGTYEILVEDEVEHACKLLALSDTQKRTRKACDAYVQDHTDANVATSLLKTHEAKKVIGHVEHQAEGIDEAPESGYASAAD